MKKLLTLSTLIAAAFAFNAQAASHAGAAPMKASEPAAKASDAKKDAAKAEKKEEKKAEKK
jgi:hypothetical protein